MQSAGISIPVFAGTLYSITGIGELSATWRKIKFILKLLGLLCRVIHSRFRGVERGHGVEIFFSHFNVFRYTLYMV